MAFRYRKFPVYQEAKVLQLEIVQHTLLFPQEYRYICDQIKRSSLSIVLNIAKGSSKQSDKDFNRYIAIALGSADETVASLDIALELGLIKKETYAKLERQAETICKQLGGLSKQLKVSSN